MTAYDAESTMNSEEVRGCHLCKVYFFSTGRNAYFSTWSQKYPYESAFHTSLEAAKQHAEQQRVQGAVFSIDELPVLAFPFDDSSLLVTEINTETAFEDFLRRIPKSRTVAHIARYFTPPRANSIQRLFCDGDIPAAFFPLRQFRSRSRGKAYPLTWRQLDTEDAHDPKYAEATATRLHQWLVGPTKKPNEIRPNA